jgi:hypothetical protein
MWARRALMGYFDQILVVMPAEQASGSATADVRRMAGFPAENVPTQFVTMGRENPSAGLRSGVRVALPYREGSTPLPRASAPVLRFYRQKLKRLHCQVIAVRRRCGHVRDCPAAAGSLESHTRTRCMFEYLSFASAARAEVRKNAPCVQRQFYVVPHVVDHAVAGASPAVQGAEGGGVLARPHHELAHSLCG